MYYRLKYDESDVRYVISDSDDVVMDKNAPKNLVVLKDLNLNDDVVIKARDKREINKILSSPDLLKRWQAKLEKKEKLKQMRQERDRGKKI